MVELFLQHIKMALKELATNKLRTFLSLLGITIGVFCVISVLTVFDSLQKNIKSSMQSLGSNIIYVSKFPWIPEEEGDYPMWKYQARPSCSKTELNAIKKYVSSAAYTALSYTENAQKIKYQRNEISGMTIFATTYDFNKLQPIDIAEGRYFSVSEMQSSQSNSILIGNEVSIQLFGSGLSPIGKSIQLLDRNYTIIGVIKKQGRTFTGFDFDNGAIICYNYLASYKNIDEKDKGFSDPMLMVRSKNGYSVQDMKYEIKSILRASRKIKPSEKDNFSFNQLSTIQGSIDAIFVNFNIFGWIIGFFSLLVGSFGIANIMFVSVKERTSMIGVKKALGAKSSTILAEFLIESIILCLLGGLIGILLVFILSLLLSGPIGFPVILSGSNFAIGISISIVVGIVAGYIPAQRAAGLNPVEAIRS